MLAEHIAEARVTTGHANPNQVQGLTIRVYSVYGYLLKYLIMLFIKWKVLTLSLCLIDYVYFFLIYMRGILIQLLGVVDVYMMPYICV